MPCPSCNSEEYYESLLTGHDCPNPNCSMPGKKKKADSSIWTAQQKRGPYILDYIKDTAFGRYVTFIFANQKLVLPWLDNPKTINFIQAENGDITCFIGNGSFDVTRKLTRMEDIQGQFIDALDNYKNAAYYNKDDASADKMDSWILLKGQK